MTKKIYGVLLIVTILFAGGCKTDPAVVPDSLQNAKLIGVWFLTSLETTTQAGTDDPVTSDPITDFGLQDFYAFSQGNMATFSSTLYGRKFEGYYSVNSSADPKTLSFKSGDLLIRYNLISLDDTNLVIDQVTTSTESGVTTTITNRYTYTRLVK